MSDENTKIVMEAEGDTALGIELMKKARAARRAFKLVVRQEAMIALKIADAKELVEKTERELLAWLMVD